MRPIPHRSQQPRREDRRIVLRPRGLPSCSQGRPIASHREHLLPHHHRRRRRWQQRQKRDQRRPPPSPSYRVIVAAAAPKFFTLASGVKPSPLLLHSGTPIAPPLFRARVIYVRQATTLTS
ncbi:hypothetical protein MRX96_013926 [Rhipicephalus microplus]